MKRQSWGAEEIMAWAKNRGEFNSQALTRHFKMSRQTAARLLKYLVEEGRLAKSGATRGALYRLPKAGQHSLPLRAIKIQKKLKGLFEDRVFEQVDLRLQLKKSLSENAHRIAYYAFCEMLNNAIDHSSSPGAEIEVRLERGNFTFAIRDHGVGVFNKIKKGFHLESEEAAIEHLLKGKQTTAPKAHSGQGIFFTSKIADLFSLRSGKFQLTFNNVDDDLSLAELRPLHGTEVKFSIKLQTRKNLSDLFKTYANEDFDFDRTSYPVILLKQSGTVSRSQARRLTLGLEKFERIVLDFANVKELGQGFADEIFRVYQGKFPKYIIEVRNANSAVDFMIRRARQAKV
jgi:anti-sigma regulatory factor (Ser/Thr protein kinase)